MKHLVVGIVALVLGLIGLITWWKTFGLVMRGVIPFSLVVFGGIAALSGYRRITSGKTEDQDDHVPQKARTGSGNKGASASERT